MTIQVIEDAPDRKLTTLAKVKATLGATTDAFDEIIEDMILSASDFAVNYCGREFAMQTIRESLAGKGSPDLLLSLTPVVDIEMVEFDDDILDEASYTLYDREAGILQNRRGWRSTNIAMNTINNFPSSYYEKRIHVTYTGGYILPGWGVSMGGRTLPYDLERAIIEMVKSEFASRKVDNSIRTYKIGETSVTWDRSSDAGPGAGAPKNAIGILNYYRRVF